MSNKESIAVKLLELEDATNFKQIIEVYIEILEERSALYNYEKAVARDSLRNLAQMLDGQWFTGRARRRPISVKDWGQVNRDKHGAEDE